MIILIVTGLLVIAAGVCLAMLQYLQVQIVDLQLTTHKLMFPAQIKAARRAYLRGLLREAYQQKLKRNWAIGLSIFAVIVAVIALNFQFNVSVVTTGLDRPAFDQSIVALMRNLAISVSGLAVITATLLALSVASWQMQTQSLANQDHDENDLYFTPSAILSKQLLWRRELGLSISAIAVLFMLSGWAGWLPSPVISATMRPATQSSSSSQASSVTEETSEASSSASSHTTTNSSSWQRTDPNTQYPIDAMKEAKYASASDVNALTESDLASLYFLEYWALNGIQDSEAAGYAQAGGYSYQVVKDDKNVLTSGDTIMVFNESSATKGQIHLFYAIRNGDQVEFYNMYNSGLVITSFASQFGINTVNGHAAAGTAGIRDSQEPIAQLVTAFKSDDAFKMTKSGLTRGADLTY
ncbi:hypothetical protein [Lacticaseibacillus porcinae]|uniref:hypothetical protein n=1 Tax=Lacticaseibacillus porcinae TaxID=1123687 RepID=UPI000F7A14B5|nr:hypothetical protein [Lacticaseibacillus porcinae]